MKAADPLAPDDLFLGESLRSFYRFTEPLIGAHLRKGDRILDVGCGDGRLTLELLRSVPLATAVGVDIRPEAIRLSGLQLEHSDRVRFIVGDGQDVDWLRSLGPFDAILARTSLHHFRDPIGTLRAYADMLPPGGRLILVDLDREAACLSVFGFPLTLLITWCTVLRTLGLSQGLRAIRGMRYPSAAWRRHRAVDVAHRGKIGWYRYRDIRNKILATFSNARVGRIGSFCGYGGVHYMIYEKASDACA